MLDSAHEVHAWAPAEVGLLVYFWLRLGFSPLPGGAAGAGLVLRRRRDACTAASGSTAADCTTTRPPAGL
jgi:hypothetical protein